MLRRLAAMVTADRLGRALKSLAAMLGALDTGLLAQGMHVPSALAIATLVVGVAAGAQHLPTPGADLSDPTPPPTGLDAQGGNGGTS